MSATLFLDSLRLPSLRQISLAVVIASVYHKHLTALKPRMLASAEIV